MHKRFLLLSLVVACGGDDAQTHTDAAPAIDTPAADVDADGDGFTIANDCNDADANVHPGAVEQCNDVDDDCDGVVDNGTATFNDGSGPVDVSAVFDAGTASTPAEWTAPSLGILHLCGGTYYAHVIPTGNFELAGFATGSTIVDGGGSGPVITPSAPGFDITVHDATLTHGLATAAGIMGAIGGGVMCYGGSLTVTRAVISNSAAASGGGIAAVECATNITDTTIEGNHATQQVGGGLSIAAGTTTLTRILVATNIAQTTGNGISIVAESGGPAPRVDILDSLITGNSGGTGAVAISNVPVSFTGTTQGNAGIVANTGMGLVVEPGTGTFDATLCDFGSDVASSNTPHDISLPKNGLTLDRDDNTTVSCTQTACTP